MLISYLNYQIFYLEKRKKKKQIMSNCPMNYMGYRLVYYNWQRSPK